MKVNQWINQYPRSIIAIVQRKRVEKRSSRLSIGIFLSGWCVRKYISSRYCCVVVNLVGSLFRGHVDIYSNKEISTAGHTNPRAL